MADFKTALAITVSTDHEGGYQNRPKDSGNWLNGINYGTKWGITPHTLQAYAPQLLADPNCVRDLDMSVAEMCYSQGYWKTLYSQIDDQDVANKLFDMGVLFGVGTATRLLQATLSSGFPSIQIDGSFGPNTLSVVNQCEPKSLLNTYKSALVAHALKVATANPDDREDVAGWGRRINS